MRIYELLADQSLGRPLEEVFPFFAEPANLERITPPFLRFSILTPSPLVLRVGARIDYALRLRGLPLRWQSEITAYDPPHRFVDEQRRGPYRSWVHEHRFLRDGEGTRVLDLVRYAVPGGAPVHRTLVAGQLETIFRHRQAVVGELFEGRPGATVRIRRAGSQERSQPGALYEPGR